MSYVKSGKLIPQRGSSRSVVSCSTLVWIEELFTSMYVFKHLISYPHFTLPCLLSSFPYGCMLKQENFQAILSTQREGQIDFPEV